MSEEELKHQDIDIELCPGCLYENEPGSHFCCKCNAPLSSLSTIGPWERLQAQRHIYANAASNPQRLVSVVGIWLIFGTICIFGTFITSITLYAFYSSSLVKPSLIDLLPGLIFGPMMLFIGAFVTIRTTINYRKNLARARKKKR